MRRCFSVPPSTTILRNASFQSARAAVRTCSKVLSPISCRQIRVSLFYADVREPHPHLQLTMRIARESHFAGLVFCPSLALARRAQQICCCKSDSPHPLAD